MSVRIEDYALIGDTETAALVGKNGSIDWLCLPRFDSEACFAALLGDDRNGHWRIAPRGEVRAVRRRYRGDTLVLETEFVTPGGRMRLVDFMPPRGRRIDVVRQVEGLEGEVHVRSRLLVRFDYGDLRPWVRLHDEATWMAAGAHAVCVRGAVQHRRHGSDLEADFTVRAGERASFSLIYTPSHRPIPGPIDPDKALEDTEGFWRDWIGRCPDRGEWSQDVRRSLVTLKALTYAPTGGIVAAATTSLPERPGGVRNWDYRFCWLRDATFTLLALMNFGFTGEARAWRDWLLRAAGGDPEKLQILYGPTGERLLLEHTLPHLPGYEGSRPVRLGNAAAQQLQLDVYGEVLDALYQARRRGLHAEEAAADLLRGLLEFLEENWDRPDQGLWEFRTEPRHFTHSKVMAWVAFDRGCRLAEQFGMRGPVARWRALRDHIHAEVCRKGFDPKRNAFTQAYGSKALDASLLMIPLVGFLPAHDPRFQGTVRAIEEELSDHGFIRRYDVDDGLPPGEAVFLACTFWLLDVYALQGRRDEALRRFEQLLAIRNDVGLFGEEYDPRTGRMLGNFPQAFTHVAVVNSADLLFRGAGASIERGEQGRSETDRSLSGEA